uniref:DNA repair exonuclease n=1 Tax=Iridovirus LCIVAC01 TaxID=2506607 RepID=A0A481YQD3_9VIRU|nr:MAG: DNA repair exonuclease [Iridovirus LCIVAC01]
MKILTIGDPHFRTNNIPECELLQERLIDIISEQLPDVIVVLGDLLHYHERLHTTALNQAIEFIDMLRNYTHTFVLTGNHDFISNQQFLTNKHWMNALKEWKNVTIVDKVISFRQNNKHIILLPYVPPGRFEEALNTLQESWKTADAIFCHQEFYGVQMGAIKSLDGDKWRLDYPYVFSGHIHDRQQLQLNLYYVGSCIQHAFGESSKKTVALLKFDEESINILEIPTNLPKKKIVYINIEDVGEFKEKKDSRDHIKLCVKGTYEEFKSFKKTRQYKDLTAQGVKIAYKPQQLKEVEEVQENIVFTDILYKLVMKEKNGYLLKSYNHVLHNKNEDDDSIILFN